MPRTVRWLIASISVLCVAWPSGAEESAAPLSVSTTEIDFGNFRSTDSPQKDIPLTGTSESPLKILSAESSCGCTEATIDPVELKKGETATLHIALHIADYPSNLVHSQVLVKTDEAAHPVLQLTVRANITPEYGVTPGEANLGRIKRDASPEQVFQFTRAYGPDVQIQRIEAPPELDVKFEPVKSTGADASPTTARTSVARTSGHQGC